MMQNFEADYYQTLSVARDATDEDIRTAFRKLAKEYHPDKNPESPALFIKLRRAYETLSNQRSRIDYDRYLDLLVGRDSLLEIKPALRDLYDDMIGYIKTMAGFEKVSEYELVLKREFREREKIVRAVLPLAMICRKCAGTGGTIFSECPECEGKGKFGYEKEVDLYIPSGSGDGEMMELDFPGEKVRLTLRFK